MFEGTDATQDIIDAIDVGTFKTMYGIMEILYRRVDNKNE